MKTLKTIFLLCLSIFFVHSELMAQFPIVLNDDFITVSENTTADIEIIYANDNINDSAYIDSTNYSASIPFHGTATFCPPGMTCFAGTTYAPDSNYVGVDSFYYIIEVMSNGAVWYTDSAKIIVNVASNVCSADFTYNQTNNTVQFVGSTTWIGATPINYNWNFGDGTTGNGDTVYHNYSNAGLYNVCMTTGIDCPNTVCYEVIVQDTICNDLSLINPAVLCSPTISPVCGCDGQTYLNPCVAIYENGIVAFTPGACADSIWPGDTDYDGVVNNNDILSIGLGYGLTGPVRAGASLSWQAQYAPYWSTSLNNVNDKHVDTNGDGMIDSTDAAAINLNYGLTHSKGDGKSGTGPELIPNFMGQTILNAGSVVNASIDYGTIDTPLVNVYGLAYTIEFDTSIIDASTIALDFSNSWFNANETDLNFYKVLVGQGKIDIAQTGTDHLSKAGFGSINQMTFVIQEDLAGKTDGVVELLLKITNVKALDNNGNVINTKSGEASANIEIGTGIKDVVGNALSLYPNPSDDFIKIRSSLEVEILAVQIVSLLGVKADLSYTNNLIDVSAITPGIYFVEIQTSLGKVLKKVVIK